MFISVPTAAKSLEFRIAKASSWDNWDRTLAKLGLKPTRKKNVGAALVRRIVGRSADAPDSG